MKLFCYVNEMPFGNPPGNYKVWLPGIQVQFQFSSVAQSCPTLWDPTDCSTSGLPVHHQLPGFSETHVHPIGDAIQPSHPLLSLSPPAFNLSQHQGLFQWVSSSHQVHPTLPVNELYFSMYMKIYKTENSDYLWKALGLASLRGTWVSYLQLECFKNENIFQNYLYK